MGIGHNDCDVNCGATECDAPFDFQFRRLAEPEPSVKIPTTEDEAVLMLGIALNWLQTHAPHRLKQPPVAPEKP